MPVLEWYEYMRCVTLGISGTCSEPGATHLAENVSLQLKGEEGGVRKKGEGSEYHRRMREGGSVEGRPQIKIVIDS